MRFWELYEDELFDDASPMTPRGSRTPKQQARVVAKRQKDAEMITDLTLKQNELRNTQPTPTAGSPTPEQRDAAAEFGRERSAKCAEIGKRIVDLRGSPNY
jgi:hypothetical protein